MLPRRALIFSFVLHAVIMLLLSYWGIWARKREFEIPPPIAIELAEVSEITQTTKAAPAPQPEKEEEKPVAPAPPKPPKSDAPAPPEMEEDLPDLPDPNAPKADEKKPEVKKPPVPKPRPPKPDPKKTDKPKESSFDSVLKNLVGEDTPPAPQQPDMNVGEAAPAGQNAPVGDKLTMSEEDALRHQLEGCWNVPVGARDAQDLVIEIRLVVNPDRTVRQATIVNQSRYNQDAFFRAAADSAIRAVRHPNCTPLALPEDKYTQWQSIVVTFNPKEMF